MMLPIALLMAFQANHHHRPHLLKCLPFRKPGLQEGLDRDGFRPAGDTAPHRRGADGHCCLRLSRNQSNDDKVAINDALSIWSDHRCLPEFGKGILA